MMGGDNFVETVTRRIADYLMEREKPGDWSGFFTSMTEKEEPSTPPEKEPLPKTSPPHNLSDYTAIYNHPGYGDLEISMKGNSLYLQYGQLQGLMSHRHYDVFKLEHDRIKNRKMGFITHKNGHIHQLTLALERSVPDLVFTKKTQPKPGQTDQ